MHFHHHSNAKHYPVYRQITIQIAFEIDKKTHRSRNYYSITVNYLRKLIGFESEPNLHLRFRNTTINDKSKITPFSKATFPRSVIENQH